MRHPDDYGNPEGRLEDRFPTQSSAGVRFPEETSKHDRHNTVLQSQTGHPSEVRAEKDTQRVSMRDASLCSLKEARSI